MYRLMVIIVFFNKAFSVSNISTYVIQKSVKYVAKGPKKYLEVLQIELDKMAIDPSCIKPFGTHILYQQGSARPPLSQKPLPL